MTVLSSNSGTKCFCIFESVHVGLEVVHNFAALEVSMLFFPSANTWGQIQV